jgi:AcrR family transcriptional regulator
MDDFAARLRCSKSTLYRLAPSKEQLVLVVARHFFSGAATRIEAAVAEASTSIAKVATYLTSVGREMSRGSRAFHEQMASEPFTSELYLNQAHTAAARVRQLIHEGVRNNAFQVADPEFAGQVVAVVLDSIHLGGFALMSGDTPADAHAKLSELVLYGLLGRPADDAHAALGLHRSDATVSAAGTSADG